MSDTKSLLHRIAAFRERLEQTPTLSPSFHGGGIAVDATLPLQLAAKAGMEPNFLQNTLRKLVGVTDGPAALPHQITTRTRHFLEQVRQYVRHQREVSEDPFFVRLSSETTTAPDTLVTYHHGTVTATEAALRLVQAMPESAEFQTRICDGLETMMNTVRDRLALTRKALDERRKDFGRMERLARLLCDVQARRMVSFQSFAEMAEELLEEAQHHVPLRIVSAPVEPVARFVAAHALNVGKVLARILPHDYEWASKPVVPVAAALMMDIGMLVVPVQTLQKTHKWNDADLRAVEAHPVAGARLLREVMPELGPLTDAIAMHHERSNGLGYPVGAKAEVLPSLARLLALADTYAALSEDRPHRAAKDPRTVLTEILEAGEKGELDRGMAEEFLNLSFHPAGTVVELNDGRVGVVISTQPRRADLRATVRPVVAVITNSERQPLPRPEVVDLSNQEFGGIVRGLTRSERRKVLGSTHPDLCY